MAIIELLTAIIMGGASFFKSYDVWLLTFIANQYLCVTDCSNGYLAAFVMICKT